MSATDTGPGYPPGSLRFSRPEGCGELLHAVVRLEGQADNWGRLVRKVLYLHASRPRRRRGWLNGPASVATSLEGEGPRGFIETCTPRWKNSRPVLPCLPDRGW